MNLSENKDYLEYGNCLAQNRFEDAIAALDRCIETAKRDGDFEEVAFLLGSRAEILHEQGDAAGAVAQFVEAEEIANNSPLTKLHFAKFLCHRVNDYPWAIAKCDEVVSIVESPEYRPPANDLEKGFYLKNAHGVRGRSLLELGDLQGAEDILRKLLELKGDSNEAVNFCEHLIEKDVLVELARYYLSRTA